VLKKLLESNCLCFFRPFHHREPSHALSCSHPVHRTTMEWGPSCSQKGACCPPYSHRQASPWLTPLSPLTPCPAHHAAMERKSSCSREGAHRLSCSRRGARPTGSCPTHHPPRRACLGSCPSHPPPRCCIFQDAARLVVARPAEVYGCATCSKKCPRKKNNVINTWVPLTGLTVYVMELFTFLKPNKNSTPFLPPNTKQGHW
jgi:hypothetical protein